MSPRPGAETEQAECYQERSICEHDPIGHVLERPRTDAAGERHKAGTHPGRIGTLRRQDVAIGSQYSSPVGAVFDPCGRMLEFAGRISDFAAAARQMSRSALRRHGWKGC
jgi:hypothetical protein